MTEEYYSTLDELVEELNRDPEYRKADREIKPYYDLVLQIIKRRSELGLTQKDLAEKAETHQSRISKIESAQHDIRLSTLIKIAEALNTEVSIQLIPFEELPPLSTSTELTWSFIRGPKPQSAKIVDISVEL